MLHAGGGCGWQPMGGFLFFGQGRRLQWGRCKSFAWLVHSNSHDVQHASCLARRRFAAARKRQHQKRSGRRRQANADLRDIVVPSLSC